MGDIVDVLGRNIRTRRKRLGWTQERLAEKAGISVPFMTQIELGRKTASLDVVESVASALGVPYSELFELDAPSASVTEVSLRALECNVSDAVKKEIENWFSAILK